MSSEPLPSSYVCDTIPAARLAPAILPRSDTSPPEMAIETPHTFVEDTVMASTSKSASPEQENPAPPARKLCVRHQRMADEGTNLKLQQSLDALPLQEREAVNAVWSNFSSSSHPRRALILQGLLTMCCFSQLSLLTEQLSHLIRIDPFAVLPREVSLKILGYLDATSLCRAAQVSKHWKSLADDDILWRGICEQHIGQKCHKCGWGLPRLDKKRIFRVQSSSPSPSPGLQSPVNKRETQQTLTLSERPQKRQRLEPSEVQSLPPEVYRSDRHSKLASTSTPPPTNEFEPHSDDLLVPIPSAQPSRSLTRPWKSVYSERLTIERNWRRGRCTVHTLKGHSDGVMCLQFSETLSHPSFPVLITGSYDRTARVWNLETGTELRCLKGHTRAIRDLQFDDVKLITGSMDHTIRIWDWRSGRCIRTLTGHTEGVVSLNFDSNVLASGSVDATVKVWNLRTGEAFTLRGHHDWVNSVQLWDSNPDSGRSTSSSSTPMFDSLPSGGVPSPSSASYSNNQIDPGKMLFSASDDGTIRLWDLTLRTCVRQYTGHVGQVQSMKLLGVDDGCDDDEREYHNAFQEAELEESGDGLGEPIAKSTNALSPSTSSEKHPKTVLISGSLDNTIKLWDVDTTKAVRTLFGHIEGVWAVASDKLRLVSGSHDRTIKVWNREDGRCTATLVGHRGAVTCLSLGDDKIVSGSDDGDVKIWSFAG